jgi:hypothetical protein
MTQGQTTRRAFIGQLGFVAGMGAMAHELPGLWSIRAAGAAAMPARPVVSIFMDLPWVDMTGRAEPYVPPRRAAPPRRAPDEDFGNYQYYMV